MILYAFLLGACFFMNCLYSAVAVANRRDDAPYRLAFGLFAAVAAGQCLSELLAYLLPGMEQFNEPMVVITRDAIGFPFMLMEMEALYEQNVKAYPWSVRLRRLAISESVFVFFFILSVVTDWSPLMPTLFVTIWCFILVFAYRMYRKLKEYMIVLSYTTDTRNRKINWMMWVFATNILVIIIYCVTSPYFESFALSSTYLISDIILMTIHAYYVARQRPMDAKEMARIKAIINEENERMHQQLKQKMQEVEEQSEALMVKTQEMKMLTDVMSQNAEKLKRKADIKEYMDVARLQHPHLLERLRKAGVEKITDHDLLICMLIYDGRKITFIANKLGVNTRSIEMARSRLRKKFGLKPEQKLHDFIRSFENAQGQKV